MGVNRPGQTISALVVDDSAPLRLAIANTLTRHGWHVTTAANGIEGLEAVRSQPFDVVITDVNMPERGGLWLRANALALRPELRGRFVLISSEPLPEPHSMGLFVDAEHFIIKPISLTTLLSEVQSIVRQAVGTRSDLEST
jgi:CheY-like chemotaxis protein